MKLKVCKCLCGAFSYVLHTVLVLSSFKRIRSLVTVTRIASFERRIM